MWSRAAALAFVSLAGTAGPASAQAGETRVQLDSEPGDVVGLGQAWSYESGTSLILGNALASGAGVGAQLSVFADADWSLSFARAGGEQLDEGTYEDAIKFSAFYEQHAIEVVRGPLVCNAINGRFDVLSITYDAAGGLEAAAIDFEQRCDYASAALRGQARLNIVPGSLPVANAGPDQSRDEGTPATLDGSASSDDGSIAAYRWTQVAGPPVALLDSQSATPSIAALPDGPSTLGFRLQVTDDTGSIGFDAVDIVVLRSEMDTGPPASDPPAGGAGAPALASLSLLLLAGLRRRRRVQCACVSE